MSHTYKDEETGVIFHYDSDFSGDVSIVIPPGAMGDGTEVTIPADSLSRFLFRCYFDSEEVTESLKRLWDWFVKHDNCATHPRPIEPPPAMPVDAKKTRVE